MQQVQTAWDIYKVRSIQISDLWQIVRFFITDVLLFWYKIHDQWTPCFVCIRQWASEWVRIPGDLSGMFVMLTWQKCNEKTKRIRRLSGIFIENRVVFSWSCCECGCHVSQSLQQMVLKSIASILFLWEQLHVYKLVNSCDIILIYIILIVPLTIIYQIVWI